MLNNPFLSPEQNRVVQENTGEVITSGVALLYAQYMFARAQSCKEQADSALLEGNTKTAATLLEESGTFFRIATDEYPFFVFKCQPGKETSSYSAYRIPSHNFRAVSGSVVTLDEEFIQVAAPGIERAEELLKATQDFAAGCVLKQISVGMLC